MGSPETQSESAKTGLGWLKEFSGIGLGAAAVLYVCGYLIHTVYYRLIGVDVGGQPLDYLTFSGDYLISIFISIPQLFSLLGDYGSYLFRNYLWLSMLSCLVCFTCILLFHIRWSDRKWFRWPVKEWLRLFICFLLVIAAFPIIFAEINVLRVQNVLQPFSPDEIQGAGEQTRYVKSMSLQERIELIKAFYEEHATTDSSLTGSAEWTRWFGPLAPDNERERNRSYLAFLLINIIFLGTLIAVILTRGAGHLSNIAVAEALVGLTLPLILFPCIYATLGKAFLFPVVTLELKVERSDFPDKKTSEMQKTLSQQEDVEPEIFETHPVYLVFQDSSEIIVYDRLNLFSLKRISRSEVLTVRQLYKSSPFQNCDLQRGEFSPCEAVWLKEEKSIIDF